MREAEAKQDDWGWLRLGIGALLGGNAMVVGLAVNLSTLEPNLRLFLEIALLGSTVIVFELLGRPLLAKAWEAVKKPEITFEFLFLTGIVGALGTSVASMIRGEGPVYFEIASLLLVVYAAGNRVGRVSRERGLESARALRTDRESCRIETDCGETRTVALEEVGPGDRVVVDPGETLPVDGVVARGEGFVRDAHVTGEWASSVKRPGDRAYAGSEAIDGSLVLETEAALGDRLIDSIRDSVEAAWEHPSEWQLEADRIVQWFFPVVVALTLGTFGYWFWTSSWETALFHSLAVLLIACPCALGFAVPLAVWMTLGSYAERGIIAEGGDFVERLARCDTAIFDKTGTLTTGAGRLVDFVADDAIAERRKALQLAQTLERGSRHPVAEAFQPGGNAPVDENDGLQLRESNPITGVGIEGCVFDRDDEVERRVAVGTGALVPDEERESFERLVDDLRNVDGARRLAVVVDGRVAAAAAVAEQPADRLAAMQSELSDAEIASVLVTGDRSARAERLGFERVHARMTPDEKERLVRELRDDSRRVLFVGDGINDAAAMSAADVSIAKADGSELTVDVADATWHGEAPTAISSAVSRARQAVSLIHTNLIWAVVYNVAGITAAAAGLLHPVLAAVLMVTSSLFVTWRTALGLEERSAPS